jgi:ethanolamine phosphate phosphodiesterase
MAVWPNPALLILLVAALLAFEDWLTTPSCSGGTPEARASGDLRAMMVADLMLLGSTPPTPTITSETTSCPSSSR